MELIIRIRRTYGTQNQTTGVCTVENENKIVLFSSLSLERGWQDNKKNISCIPIGVYHCVLEWSNRFQKSLWEVYGVEGRAECKFHSANFWHQLNGCISLGNMLLNIGGDIELDLTRSKKTMQDFHEVLRPMNGKIVKLIIE